MSEQGPLAVRNAAKLAAFQGFIPPTARRGPPRLFSVTSASILVAP